MPENYKLSGFYRQDGRRGMLRGDVVIDSPTGTIRGSIVDPSSPERNRTIEGRVKREGLQAELGFLVEVPGDKFLNIHYRVRGNPANGSFAGVYQGTWMPVSKTLGMTVIESYITCRTQEEAFVCKFDMLVPKKRDMHSQYAQITLTKKSEKKTIKRKKK
jgi:hypothetical protein